MSNKKDFWKYYNSFHSKVQRVYEYWKVQEEILNRIFRDGPEDCDEYVGFDGFDIIEDDLYVKVTIIQEPQGGRDSITDPIDLLYPNSKFGDDWDGFKIKVSDFITK